METVRLACRAMATRFELVLQGDDAVRLRAAGEEALAEIERLEARLSFYRASSDIGRINAGAGHAPVPVAPPVFHLLQQAARLHGLTDGAFDPTVGPLMRCWGFAGGAGHRPAPAALTAARALTGMHRVHLDPDRYTVAFERPGMLLDLGGIGKGYAVDEAVALLREAGVERALLHGGTSTVYALGHPEAAWRVALPHPATEAPLAVVSLTDEALSVSACRGKAFREDDLTYGHVLDPRTGHPVRGAVLAAVAAPSATATDALATALLVLGQDGLAAVEGYDDVRALIVMEDETTGTFEVLHQNLPPAPCALRQTLFPKTHTP